MSLERALLFDALSCYVTGTYHAQVAKCHGMTFNGLGFFRMTRLHQNIGMGLFAPCSNISFSYLYTSRHLTCEMKNTPNNKPILLMWLWYVCLLSLSQFFDLNPFGRSLSTVVKWNSPLNNKVSKWRTFSASTSFEMHCNLQMVQNYDEFGLGPPKKRDLRIRGQSNGTLKKKKKKTINFRKI